MSFLSEHWNVLSALLALVLAFLLSAGNIGLETTGVTGAVRIPLKLKDLANYAGNFVRGVFHQPQAVAKVRDGTVFLLVPRSMLTTKPQTVRVKLKTTADPNEDLRREIDFGKDWGRTGNPIIEEKVQGIGSRMKATLAANADMFTVSARSEEEQDVGSNGIVEWAWSVTPSAPGTDQISVRLTVVKDLAGGDLRQDIFERSVEVTVRRYSVFGHAWGLAAKYAPAAFMACFGSGFGVTIYKLIYPPVTPPG